MEDNKNIRKDNNDLDRRDLSYIVNYLAELDKSLTFSGVGMNFDIHEHFENKYHKEKNMKI